MMKQGFNFTFFKICKDQCFGLVWFYGISTIIAKSKPNPVYTCYIAGFRSFPIYDFIQKHTYGWRRVAFDHMLT